MNTPFLSKPKRLDLKTELVKSVKCCAFSTYLLTENNTLFYFGNRRTTAFTHVWGGLDGVGLTVMTLDNEEQITAISCGYDHTLVLSITGKVYAWGLNDNGQLGVGDDNERNTPTVMEMPENVFFKQISCGYNHSLLLTTEGHIYSCGLNNCGQLGTGDENNRLVPNLIDSNLKFCKISAFGSTSMALSQCNKVFICGKLRDGTQLTLLDTDLDSFQEAINTFRAKIFTYKPLSFEDLFYKKPINRMDRTMAKVFNEEKYCDLKFKLKIKGSEEKFDYIYVQKWFIANTSEYFERMFANNWSENNNNEIAINSYSYEAYYHFIRCLYTDSIETEDLEILLEMLSISDEYLDEELKRKCVQKIKPLMNVQNVCSIYSSSLTNRSKDLEEFCFKFMSKYMSFITESEDYKQMSDSLAKHFLTNYFKLNSNH